MVNSNQKPGKFITGIVKGVTPSSPESLFLDLKARQTPYLWSHQAEILNAYDSLHHKTRDIALELPTGTGKTLIGLLLAEYRRRKYDERVIYLCPTRQLAYQVGQLSKQYDIYSHILTPPDYNWIHEYRSGSCVGIATYSSVFNVKPRIDDAQIIVLDDAHSAENYIADLWSVSISRTSMDALYDELINLVRMELPEWFADIILDVSTTPEVLANVDMLPLPRFWKYQGAIRDLLNEALENQEERFSWTMIRGSLHACCMYISGYEILIRPIIPPTLTHKPFADANQRIYMSATLGEGGELERITGIRRIERLPVPKSWEKQSAGRRFFLFPNLSLEPSNTESLTIAAIQQSQRALILTPSYSSVNYIKQQLSNAGITVFESKDIEQSIDNFKEAQQAAAIVLANRYDGIDLPGDVCRLLILEGLPAGISLQERFFLNRLSATSLLRDRLRTRFTQGVGRCCRNVNDYAAVIVIGQRALDFCEKTDIRSGMHPELQAELKFGLVNSEDLGSAGFLERIQLLYEQGEAWKEAETEILRLREESVKKPDPLAHILMDVVNKEVDFIYDLWKRDYISALEKATQISDKLGGGEAAGYRAWWYYLAGSVAWLAGTEQHDDSLISKARELFGHAAKASNMISWFAELAHEVTPEQMPPSIDIESAHVCEEVYARLENLGFHGKTFEKRISEFSNLIGQQKSSAFEQGLEILGDLLGFNSYRPDDSGAPDGVWLLLDHLAIALEAKSEEVAHAGTSLHTVRQANTHEKWIRDNYPVATDAKVYTIVISPRTTIDLEAQSNARGLYYIHVDKIRELAEGTIAALRRIRSQVSELDQERAIGLVHDELKNLSLLPHDVVANLTKIPLEKLPLARSKES